MKPTKILLTLAILLVPGLAAAQGYYGGGGPGYSQPPPSSDGFHYRTGHLAFGGSIGLGGMHDSGSRVTACNNCSYNPIALELDGHIGGMLSNRFALLGEFQLNAQTVVSDYYDDTVLSQTALMIAGQLWLTPQLWLKGGIGLAHLEAGDSYVVQDIGNGAALMAGIGFEVMSARNFAVDLQGRIIRGEYHGFLEDNVTSGTVGLGINWY